MAAAETLARCKMDPTKTIETEYGWIFEPLDMRQALPPGAAQASMERRRGQSALVLKADGQVKLYRGSLRADQCLERANAEMNARRDQRHTGSHPTQC